MTEHDTSSAPSPAPTPEQQGATHDPMNRCRLVLLINDLQASTITPPEMREILSAGDVATVVFYAPTMDETPWQSAIEELVATIQSMGIAAIVADHSRTAGRVNADGLQLGQDPDLLRQAIDKFVPKMMVGASNVKTRHNALVIGELQPDYLMFGKPGNDTRPEPHPKNIDLGNWWSTMVEIPCIVLGGNTPESAVEVARCGADFVALGSAIFAPQENGSTVNAADAAARVRLTNELLDAHAPLFETPDA